MKGKLVGFDFELKTLTVQFDSLDKFAFSVREINLLENEDELVKAYEDNKTRVMEALELIESLNLEKINPRKDIFDEYSDQEVQMRNVSIDISFCVKKIKEILGVRP